MSRAGLDGTHSGRIVVLAVITVLVIAGGAAGPAAGSGPGDGATISPEVTDATGEQVVVVYFGTDTPVAAATGNGSEVSADHLRDRASSDQAALDRYAEATPGVTVLDNF